MVESTTNLPSRNTNSFWNFWRDFTRNGQSAPYLLIDCAGIEGGRQRLPAQIFNRLESLFSGDLADELAEVGPYLGQLTNVSDEVGAVVLDLLDRRIAVLLVLQEQPEPRVALGFSQLHSHLRKFNVIYGPESSPLYFRYFDPRVLDDVLRVMQAPQLTEFFGPIHKLALVNEFNQLTLCSCRNGQLMIIP